MRRSGFLREFILQMKIGSVRPSYFEEKFSQNLESRFQSQLSDLEDRRFLTRGKDRFELSRDGLLQVDSFLPAFFLPQHTGTRYT